MITIVVDQEISTCFRFCNFVIVKSRVSPYFVPHNTKSFQWKIRWFIYRKKSLPVQLFRWFIPGWREKLRQRHKTAIWHFNLSLQSVKGRLFVAFNSLRSYLNLPCHEILAHVIVVKTRVELIFTLGCSLTMKGETTSDCKQKL